VTRDEDAQRQRWIEQLRESGGADAQAVARSAAHALYLRAARIEALEERLREYMKHERNVGRLVEACAPFTRPVGGYACPYCLVKLRADGSLKHAAGCAWVALCDAVRAIE
jgi:hypothetical protein